jgi:hypothetical protein
MSDDTKVPPEHREEVEPQQSPEEVGRLMDLTRDHYERVYGVRPAIILDATRRTPTGSGTRGIGPRLKRWGK